LTGCNAGQPRLWRVAIDMSPVKFLADPTCYKGSTVPPGLTLSSETNYREQADWVMWDGPNGDQYLDIGHKSFNLGNAPTINVVDLIEGTASQRIFSAQKTVVTKYPGVDANESRQTQVVVTFSDYGATPTGTIALTAQYNCLNAGANCPNPNLQSDSVSCRTQVTFEGRQISASATTVYGNTGSSGGAP
jgi:hypothetical protein